MFDTARATRQFEDAYRLIWQRYQNGEEPLRPGDVAGPIQIR